jgi:hypothetical protein
MEKTENELMAKLESKSEVDVVARHSYFQLKYFVIGKEPTHQARLWQCLREIKARKESLRSINWEIEDSEDSIELLNIDIQEREIRQKNVQNSITYEKKQDRAARREEIELKKQKRQALAGAEGLDQLRMRKNWLVEEATFFLESYQNLEELESLKPFDDFDSQKEYWGKKLADQLQLKLLLQSPLDTELVMTILALPDDIPVKQDMVRRLDSVQAQVEKLKEQCKQKLMDKKLED